MRIIIIPIRELIIPIIPIRFHKLYPVIFLRLLKFLKLADSFFTTENTEDTGLFYHAKEI